MDGRDAPRPPAGMDPQTSSELLARWSEPHRRHHTVDHLRYVLDALATLSAEGERFDPVAAETAAWFHDAVYDVTAADNEQRSADLAERMLEPSPLRDEVVRLVLMTAEHKAAAGDANAQALSDADLAILGAPADEYDRYAGHVREEFAAVPDEWYRPGRVQILTALLGGGDLFHTTAGRRLWQERAAANIEREIAALT